MTVIVAIHEQTSENSLGRNTVPNTPVTMQNFASPPPNAEAFNVWSLGKLVSFVSFPFHALNDNFNFSFASKPSIHLLYFHSNFVN